MKDGARNFLFIIALIGVVVVAGICPIVYVYFNGFANIEPGVLNGEEEWKRRAEKWKVEQEERDREINELSLSFRYMEHPFFGDNRKALYEYRNFQKVDDQLSDQFERTSDPYQAYLYELYVYQLTEIPYRDDPYKMLPVLDEWVNSRPQSYYARLVRAAFHRSYGWYFRGASHISRVSWKSREKFEHHYELARKDLSAALEMNDKDSMVYVLFLEIAYKTGESRESIENFYRKAVALQPLSFHARIMRFRAALPSWRGSWEELDSVIAEAESHLEEFPLLGLIRLRAEAQMGSRSQLHEDTVARGERYMEWAQPYLDQLERNPDEPLLMMGAMWYMVEGGEHEAAYPLFRQLESNYYETFPGHFRDVLQFNERRAFIYARAVNFTEFSQRKISLAYEAYYIGPNHYYTNYILGRELLSIGSSTKAMDYLRRSIEINPDYPWTHYSLARAEEKSGNTLEALERSQALLQQELDPELRKAVEALVRRNTETLSSVGVE